MKKLIALMMALLMLVTMACVLTACDDGEGQGTTTKATTTTTKRTTTTAPKLTMSDEEIEETFTALAEKAHRLGFYASVQELSPHSVAGYMRYVDGTTEAYGKAANGVTLYKKTVLIQDINSELIKSFATQFDFTGVKEGVAEPATYEYKHEGGYFVYYDLDHNLKLEKYTYKIDDYTTTDNVNFVINYTVDYAKSDDVKAELRVRYFNNMFVIISNLKK